MAFFGSFQRRGRVPSSSQVTSADTKTLLASWDCSWTLRASWTWWSWRWSSGRRASPCTCGCGGRREGVRQRRGNWPATSPRVEVPSLASFGLHCTTILLLLLFLWLLSSLWRLSTFSLSLLLSLSLSNYWYHHYHNCCYQYYNYHYHHHNQHPLHPQQHWNNQLHVSINLSSLDTAHQPVPLWILTFLPPQQRLPRAERPPRRLPRSAWSASLGLRVAKEIGKGNIRLVISGLICLLVCLPVQVAVCLLIYIFVYMYAYAPSIYLSIMYK